MTWYEWINFILGILSFIIGIISLILSILLWKYTYSYYKANRDNKKISYRWKKGEIDERDIQNIINNTKLQIKEHSDEIKCKHLQNNPYFQALVNLIINISKDK